jgi:hypothetical protein
MTFVAVLSKRRLRPQVAWNARAMLCVWSLDVTLL